MPIGKEQSGQKCRVPGLQSLHRRVTMRRLGLPLFSIACSSRGAGSPHGAARELHSSQILLKFRGRGHGRGRQREPMAGDWTCPCGVTNGRSRRECFKCSAPAPPLPLGETRPKLPGEDPQDWACPCGKMNYRGNVNCHKCGMPKPVPPPPAGEEVTMWKCTKCRNINRKTRKQCFKCGNLQMVVGQDFDHINAQPIVKQVGDDHDRAD